MCPGTDYQLTFNTKHCDGMGIHCQVKWKFGQRDWSPPQGFPTPDDCKDYPTSVYDVKGFNVGDAGTVVDGADAKALDVPFAIWMACDGETFDVEVGGFELVANKGG